MSLNHFSDIMIPTYIINLKHREDRRESIVKEFDGKPEFDCHIVEACVHEKGNIGLWESIKKTVKIAIQNEDDVIIIVEDDHVFTDHYNRDSFIENVIESNEQGADILSGGIGGGFRFVVPITENRFWINHFWCTQFMVIYSRFFDQILNADFGPEDTADNFLSQLTAHKMVLYPFVSVQKDFGYSDITEENNISGNIEHYFKTADITLQLYQKKYKQLVLVNKKERTI
ncbi:glycosyl transferase [Chryseobacterium sp. D764]|uniref:glycosyl transferase n=1 Tax=unclassified Chryseobacterium TaxID=2593645 RepID=UPI0009876688|nr:MULTISPECIES: glycosyl transferase [unclassified Chryseobacterium]QXU48086.1 glycosyl transferase [Chryseobacterium sp. D764]